jgi:hypothetical protein
LPPSAVRGLPSHTVVSSNVGLGLVTATVRAWRSGRPVGKALRGGAVGGAIMGGGMAIGGRRFPAARLLSVQTVALGANMARNAGSGTPLWSALEFPLAPLVVSVGRRDSAAAPVRVRVSAASLTAVGMRLSAEQGMRLDWRKTFATGGMVLRTSDPDFDRGVRCPPGQPCSRAGNQRWGVIAYREGISTDRAVQATLAHEAMHVAQRARDLVLFGIPASDAVAQRGGSLGRTASRFVVFDAVMPLRAVNTLSERLAGSSYRSWYEREARTFAPGSAGSFLAVSANPP